MPAEGRHPCQIELLRMGNKSPNIPKGMAGTKSIDNFEKLFDMYLQGRITYWELL